MKGEGKFFFDADEEKDDYRERDDEALGTKPGWRNLYKVKRCGEWGAMRAPEAPGGPTCTATLQC